MFGRVILALTLGPLYGVLVAICVIPIALVGNAIIAAFGFTAVIMPILLIVATFVVQAMIWVQTARYAAAFTGLAGFKRQPDFFEALGKGLFVSVIGIVLLAVATVAIVLVFLEFRGGEALWWLNAGQLTTALQVALSQPDRLQGVFSFEGFDLIGLLLALQITYNVFLTLIAIFIVPAACGISSGMDRSYSLRLIFVRFFIALPLFAVLTLVVGQALLWGVVLAVSTFWEALTVVLFVRYLFEFSLFAGMIFAFESLMIRSGAAQEEEEALRAASAAQVERNEEALRALRHARMDR